MSEGKEIKEVNVEDCNFNEFVNAVDNIIQNEQSNSANYDSDDFEPFDGIKLVIEKIKSLINYIIKVSAPDRNYHILGYISYFYLIYIMLTEYRPDYNDYEALCWMITIFSGWSAYKIYKNTPKSIWILLFTAQAIAYNPIYKLHIDDYDWKKIGIASIILIIVYCIQYMRKNKQA